MIYLCSAFEAVVFDELILNLKIEKRIEYKRLQRKPEVDLKAVKTVNLIIN